MKGTARLRAVAWVAAPLILMACDDPGAGGEEESLQQLVAGEGRLGPLPSAEGAEIYLITPQDGDTVESPVTFRFGLRGMGVSPVGLDIDRAGHRTGHHHLLINEPDVDLTAPLPEDHDQILHFGGGQTETELDLPAGEYRFQLVLGDWKHQPHDPPVTSEVVTVTVRD